MDRIEAIEAGDDWIGRKRGVIDLQIHWVPGHCGFEPNKRADEEAKKAAKGDSSDAKLLPLLLCKHLPISISAIHQEHSAKLKKRWERK